MQVKIFLVDLVDLLITNGSPQTYTSYLPSRSQRRMEQERLKNKIHVHPVALMTTPSFPQTLSTPNLLVDCPICQLICSGVNLSALDNTAAIKPTPSLDPICSCPTPFTTLVCLHPQCHLILPSLDSIPPPPPHPTPPVPLTIPPALTGDGHPLVGIGTLCLLAGTPAVQYSAHCQSTFHDCHVAVAAVELAFQRQLTAIGSGL